MATLPVINNVFRCTLLWNTNVGITPRNVFHVRASGATQEDVALAVEASAVDHLVAPMSAAWDCPEIAVLKLDGSSAGQIFSLSSGTFLGGVTGSDVIPQATAVVSFHTAQRGPRGRGRMYVGPIAESMQAQGVLNTTAHDDMGVAWVDFIENLSNADTPLQVASYVHADAHEVTNVNVDVMIGTQRRRLDQLRA